MRTYSESLSWKRISLLSLLDTSIFTGIADYLDISFNALRNVDRVSTLYLSSVLMMIVTDKYILITSIISFDVLSKVSFLSLNP